MFSMLFNLLLAVVTVLLHFFFLFHVVFNSFFTISVVIENKKLKLALAFYTGAPITLANEAIETPPFLQIKQLIVKTIQQNNSQRQQHNYEVF